MGVSRLKENAEARKFNNRSVRRETKIQLRDYTRTISPWPEIYVLTNDPPKLPGYQEKMIKFERS